MRIFRAATAALLTLVCTLAITAFIGLMTLSTTVLNRDAVKTWLDKSGVYTNALSAAVKTNTAEEQPSLLTNEMLQRALERTFPPSYIEQNTEKVIDTTYDWLHGKTDRIAFSIPINDQRPALANNLTAEIEPVVAKLPPCVTRSQLVDPVTAQCLPPRIDAHNYAGELASRAAASSTLFEKPITEKSFGEISLPGADVLRAVATNVSWLIIALPLLAIFCAVDEFFVARTKFAAVASLGRRVFFSTLLGFILGLVALYLGSSVQIGSVLGAADPAQQAIVAQLIDPVLRQAIPDIGRNLSIISAAVLVVSFATWLIMRKLHKDREEQQQLTPPSPAPSEAPTLPEQPQNN
ncbi:MAG: hypothetical protein ACREGJ_04235 [Candidatus Saccharimonadales bacterium]